MGLTVEVCVDSAAGLAAACAGGADRIELCSALPLGGLTPSPGLMALAASCGRPALAMIRPRAGDFVFTDEDLIQMEADISATRAAGLAGVVLGASLPDGRLDQPALARLIGSAAGLDLTLHRAFDMVPDRSAALETAIALGFRRILTSGGALTAVQGVPAIADLVRQARGRIVIMPGSGIGPAHAALFARLGVTELHGSCAQPVAQTGPAVDMGFAPATERRTDPALVRALRDAFHAANGAP